jgi:rhodanese-related sulfurtransferase
MVPSRARRGNLMNAIKARVWRVAACTWLLAVLSVPAPSRSELVAEIEVAPAAQRIDQKKVFVLDVREPSEYVGGHIAGSVLIPLGQVNARIGELLKHKDHPMIVVCGSGVRSAAAIEMLRKHGFTRMHNLKGGMNAWRKAKLPVVKP